MTSLVTVLKYGSLPLQIRRSASARSAPTLGLNFLQQSILAGIIGIALVFIFMLVHYRLPGVVACVALIFYTLVSFAIFRFIPVTLTLAGVAAFVLSVGMAVDANILIFERTKEELRSGKTLVSAIEAGFNRAWNSIFDSNMSSIITGDDPVLLRIGDDPRLRARADHRRAVVDVHRGHPEPDDVALDRASAVGPPRLAISACRRTSSSIATHRRGSLARGRASV